MSLRDLEPLKVSYASDTDDIVNDFYNPCLREARAYDRIAGYFSSSAYVLARPALRHFVAVGGRARVLCSPRLTAEDAEHLEHGYRARDDEELARELTSELEHLLGDPELRAHAQLLAILVAEGHLEVRFATVSAGTTANQRRMFHDKVGVFTDDAGDMVGFGGSMNETLNGLLHNVESVSVWPSWEGGRDGERVREASQRFEALWRGQSPGVKVHRLPGAARAVLERVADETSLEEALDHVASSQPPDSSPSAEDGGRPRLRRHQHTAVQQWVGNEYRGVLEHATGAGKTLTGIECMRVALGEGLTPVLLVPSALLLEQWKREIAERLGVRPVLCGAGATRWREESLVRSAVEFPGDDIVVSVANTAASSQFLGQLRGHDRTVALIADEVHRLGSPRFSEVLDRIDASARLGLSATPERAGDPQGTERLLSYFGGVIHRYTIADALRDGHLAPYDYDLEFVSLADDEQRRWEALTAKIKRVAAQAATTSDGAEGWGDERLRRLLIDRARILKNAQAKPRAAVDVLAREYQRGQRWLVYCDNIAQLEDTIAEAREAGLDAQRYYRGMDDDAEQVLGLFRDAGGVLVSIRCLDEGVDIPAADHALLLASSQNPREHIQRRGRVLRWAPRKVKARLIDLLTLPHTVDTEDDTWTMVVSEIARAVEFDQWSRAPGGVEHKLRRKWVELGLPLELLSGAHQAGIEDDDESEHSQ